MNINSHEITIPTRQGPEAIELAEGQILFVLGANGMGKSSLMHYLAKTNPNNYWSSARRQLTLGSAAPSHTAAQFQQTLRNTTNYEHQDESRWNPYSGYESAKPSLTLSALSTAQRLRDRSVTAAMDAGDATTGVELAKATSDPVTIINDLFRAANLPISFSLSVHSEEYMATKDGAIYPITQLSDGERNAFILCANVQTQKAGTLFLLDEPERHIHRSIISPLLSEILKLRPDCRFVVSSHAVDLPLDFPEAKVVILRDCKFGGSNPASWEFNLLQNTAVQIPESLKIAILGSRRNIVFAEGEGNRSLDLKLYRHLIPNATVVQKGSRAEVARSVKDVNGCEEYTWVTAFGIVDGDSQPLGEEDGDDNVYLLDSYAIESLYYHPEVQRVVGGTRAQSQAEDIDARIAEVNRAVIGEYESSIESDDAKRIQASGDADYAARIISGCKIKSSAIPNKIATGLGFSKRREYEQAVCDRLVSDSAFVETIRRLDSGLRDLCQRLANQTD